MKINMFFTFCMSALIFFAIPVRAFAQYEISAHCMGNSWSSCFIRFDGMIEEGVFEAFERIFSEYDYGSVYLNSPGGNLLEALKVGRLIRSQERDTFVGYLQKDPEDQFTYLADVPSNGQCESACAYMFMGGVVRNLEDLGDQPGMNRLGFHRFSSHSVISSDESQVASALVVEYLVEMGIDARIFLIASESDSDDMHYLTADEAQEFGISDRHGFSDFYLEPYKNGIIAVSRNSSVHGLRPRPYQHTKQITFYCENSAPRILLTSSLTGVADEVNQMSLEGEFHHNYYGDDPWNKDYDLPASWVSAREKDGITYVIIDFPKSRTDSLLTALSLDNFTVDVSMAKGFGGDFIAELNLTEMDRNMIMSSLRFCI